MPDTQGVATKRRRLRTELRRLREASGLNQAEVVRELDWSTSKLIRIENGSVGVSVTDVRALLGVYRAPDDAVDGLVQLARATKSVSGGARIGTSFPRPIVNSSVTRRKPPHCFSSTRRSCRACCRPKTTSAPSSPRSR